MVLIRKLSLCFLVLLGLICTSYMFLVIVTSFFYHFWLWT